MALQIKQLDVPTHWREPLKNDTCRYNVLKKILEKK